MQKPVQLHILVWGLLCCFFPELRPTSTNRRIIDRSLEFCEEGKKRTHSRHYTTQLLSLLLLICSEKLSPRIGLLSLENSGFKSI